MTARPARRDYDRQHRAERGARRDAEHAGFGQRVAKQPLQRRAAHAQAAADDEPDQRARQPHARRPRYPASRPRSTLAGRGDAPGPEDLARREVRWPDQQAASSAPTAAGSTNAETIVNRRPARPGFDWRSVVVSTGCGPRGGLYR